MLTLTDASLTISLGPVSITSAMSRMVFEPLRLSGTCERPRAAIEDTVMLLQVYMVPLDLRLGREQLTNILRTGHSRIPVHEPGSPQEVVGLLLVKELVLLDPDDEVRP